MPSHRSKKASTSQSSKAGITLPIGRFGRFMRKGKYAERIGASAAVALGGIMEYLVNEIMDLAGAQAEEVGRTNIVPRHIYHALKDDESLERLFADSILINAGVKENIEQLLLKKKVKKAKKKTQSQAH